LHKPRMCSESVFTNFNVGTIPDRYKVVCTKAGDCVSRQGSVFKYAKRRFDKTNNHLLYRNRFLKSQVQIQSFHVRYQYKNIRMPFADNFCTTFFLLYSVFRNFSFLFLNPKWTHRRAKRQRTRAVCTPNAPVNKESSNFS
jgi:hypothetical protein